MVINQDNYFPFNEVYQYYDYNIIANLSDTMKQLKEYQKEGNGSRVAYELPNTSCPSHRD